ncbi:MAG TPA: peptidylprolyl isomerase [Rectinema sp.]|jgi:FKBP-type peptidyl-prolyl cis-trans isomerase SlyD|nr:peptidylprolyl isomerase [Rectinema sp.]HOE76977.1 peptidylprolyl isomerase [Rectinema sp.]HOM92455.1 peptidylprolyl isomerase [Rectinema sp.]HPB07750.1 peptidylprolyl isomerase [Rectinema sp.]HPL72362.1 peptidylprolyl isomerase [Rectinema sp.]
MEIKKDRVVTIDYSLSDDVGRIIDSSEENEPLVYLHGNDNIIPGLERELEGKIPGETLSCSIPPTDAYGERNESLVFKVNKKDFGDNVEVAAGMQFEAHGEDGTLIVTVVNVDGEEVTLDANHPLAGETLHFDVKVVDVREATPEELEHGHAHGEYDDECDDDCYCDDDSCD